jgi:hypothetical protein
VIRTSGLPINLDRVEWLDVDPVLQGLQRPLPSGKVRRYLSWMPGHHTQVLVESHFERLGEEQIQILEHSHRVLRVRESGTFVHDGVAFQNEFWVDPETGFVWKSRQFLVPGLPAVEFEVLKPYRGNA